ncbi:hypothetical protein MY1884_001086 [Beauveria asiatica]
MADVLFWGEEEEEEEAKEEEEEEEEKERLLRERGLVMEDKEARWLGVDSKVHRLTRIQGVVQSTWPT